MVRTLKCIGALVLLSSLARIQAGEVVVLTSGFELRADRHELQGDQVRVYTGAGYVNLQASQVAEYKPDDYIPPAVSAPIAVPMPALSTPVVATRAVTTPRDLIAATVEKNKLPKELLALVASVMRQESGFHPDALSPKGAIGLMQLMPATARQLGVDPHNAAQNVEAGTLYLTELLKKYSGDRDQVIRALAAYNAGPGAVEKYHGVPPYKETRDYVRRVVKNYLSEQGTLSEQRTATATSDSR